MKINIKGIGPDSHIEEKGVLLVLSNFEFFNTLFVYFWCVLIFMILPIFNFVFILFYFPQFLDFALFICLFVPLFPLLIVSIHHGCFSLEPYIFCIYRPADKPNQLFIGTKYFWTLYPTSITLDDFSNSIVELKVKMKTHNPSTVYENLPDLDVCLQCYLLVKDLDIESQSTQGREKKITIPIKNPNFGYQFVEKIEQILSRRQPCEPFTRQIHTCVGLNTYDSSVTLIGMWDSE